MVNLLLIPILVPKRAGDLQELTNGGVERETQRIRRSGLVSQESTKRGEWFRHSFRLIVVISLSVRLTNQE